MSLRMSLVVAAVVAAASCAVVARSAQATYPGNVGRLAFGMSVNGGSPNIFSVLPNGRDLRQLTIGNGFNACPAYSPNGRTIVFCSGRTGAFEIWSMDANGHDQRHVTDLGAFARFPDVSPDGSRIVFGDGGVNGDANDDIYVANLDGAGLTQLTSGFGNNDYPRGHPTASGSSSSATAPASNRSTR